MRLLVAVLAALAVVPSVAEADRTDDFNKPILFVPGPEQSDPSCSPFDDMTMHGLTDELGKARRKGRTTEPYAVTKLAQRPGPLGVFVNQLERRSDMWVRHGPEPAALSGTERTDPASEHFDKEHLCQS